VGTEAKWLGGKTESVIIELKAAGKEGVRVKDLATRRSTNYGNMSAFFGFTGKKVGRGHYAWTGK
jgi:hypothetical protein